MHFGLSVLKILIFFPLLCDHESIFQKYMYTYLVQIRYCFDWYLPPIVIAPTAYIIYNIQGLTILYQSNYLVQQF